MAKKTVITRKQNKLVWGLHSLPIADGEKYGYSVLDKVIYIAGENTITVYKIDSPKKSVATREYKNTKIIKLFRGRGYVFFIYCYTDEKGNLEYYQGRLTPNAGCVDLVALNRTDAEGNLIDFIDKDEPETESDSEFEKKEDVVIDIDEGRPENNITGEEKDKDDYNQYLTEPSEREDEEDVKAAEIDDDDDSLL